MDLKFACSDALGDTHFKLIEAVADHVCETLFLQDARIEAVTVKIVKLALSEAGREDRHHAAPRAALMQVRARGAAAGPRDRGGCGVLRERPTPERTGPGAALSTRALRSSRLAARRVQDLARDAAPARVNGVVGSDEDAIAATLAWLEQAPGVTGQLLSAQSG